MTNLMRLLTATAALLVATPAAAVSVGGVAVGDSFSGFFFDGFDGGEDAATLSITSGTPTETSLTVLRNVDDPIIGFDQIVLMTASGAAFDFAPGGEVSATLEVTFDLEDAFADSVLATVVFDSPVDDIFDIFGSEFGELTVEDVAGPPTVIPLPAPAGMLLGALALLGVARTRR